MDLDHVAIATHDVSDVLSFLVGELGAPVLFGGPNLGFRALQLHPDDLRIELLEPHNVEMNDFLERFLATHGEGPHHLTFKTDDIERELERMAAAGYEPVGVNIGNPFWREAFLHPGQAGGTVVQIAQSELDPLEWKERIEATEGQESPPDIGVARWWPEPPPRAAEPAVLRRVVVATDAVARSIELYEGLLGGQREAWGEGWTELGWPSGGRIRLEQAAGRPPGIDRLEWTHAGPPIQRTVAGTVFSLYPEEDSP